MENKKKTQKMEFCEVFPRILRAFKESSRRWEVGSLHLRSSFALNPF